MTNSFFDNFGKFLNEACSGYYSTGVVGTNTGGVSGAIQHALKGMYAVDTPIGDYTTYGMNNTIIVSICLLLTTFSRFNNIYGFCMRAECCSFTFIH